MLLKVTYIPRLPLAILFILTMLMLCIIPVHAEQDSAQGKVLTMTGMKRDPATATADTMTFTGLKRRSAEVGPASTEKTDK